MFHRGAVEQRATCIYSWLLLRTWEKKSSFFFFFFFKWSIVDLQCSVSFCCTAKWFSYTCTYSLFHILFHCGLLQDIEYSSLCYRVGPCWLYSLFLYCLIVDVQIVPYDMLDLFFSCQVTFSIELLATVESCMVILSVLWEHEFFHLYLAQPWSYSVPCT